MRVNAWVCEHCKTMYLNEDDMESCINICIDKINNIFNINYVARIPIEINNFNKRVNKYSRIYSCSSIFYKDLQTKIWSKEQYTDTTDRAGWIVDIDGTILSHPNSNIQFNFCDLFKSPLMKRITIESYATNQRKNFTCKIKIYLNDFPELKKSFNIYKKLKEKSLNGLNLKKSMREVTKNLIDKNNKIKNLNAMVSFFKVRLNQTENLIYKTTKEIERSNEYIDANNVIKEYEHDSYILRSIINNFEMEPK